MFDSNIKLALEVKLGRRLSFKDIEKIYLGKHFFNI